MAFRLSVAVRAGLRLAPPVWALAAAGMASPAPALSSPAEAGAVAPAACSIVETAARSSHVPVDLLTRLVWTESRFRADATSRAGAQGIAQFMPGTAAARGLQDPFDPEQAIPKAAELLAELARQFGNLGLAAAAYNAGADRVAGWLAGTATLPTETRAYVVMLTGRAAEDWAAERRKATAGDGRGVDAEPDGESCIAITAALRADEGPDAAPVAPWGVQLSGNFSKAIALASFERARRRYARIIGELPPMVIGTVLRSRGTRRFYRVMVPAASRAAADRVCKAIAADGGACVALRS